MPIRNLEKRLRNWLSGNHGISPLIPAEQYEYLRSFVENSSSAMALFDRDMRYLAASRRFIVDLALTGRFGGSAELVGRSHYEVFPEIPERWKEIHRRCLAGATECCDRDSFRRADGRADWVRWEIRPWYRAPGVIGGLTLFSEIITDQVEMELALRASETRLATDAAALARLNNASSRLWGIRDLREGLDEMLGAAIELLGADMGNVQVLDAERSVLVVAAQRGFEQPFLDFFREVSTADNSACGRTLRTGARTVIEDIESDEPYAPLRPVARAAGYRAVQSTSLIGRDGTALGMLSTHWRSAHRPSEQDLHRLDLYARQASDFIGRCRSDEVLRKNEARLRETTERLNTLLEAAPVGISFSDDASCQQVTGNSTLLTQFEATPQDNISASAPDVAVLGRQVRFFRDGRLLSDQELPLQRAVAENMTIPSMELEVELPSGRRWYCEAAGAPLRDPDGKVTGGVAVTIDVTPRKQAEIALRSLTTNLEARVREEVMAREKAQRELAHTERLAALGRLAGGIAHDFNNVLQAVNGAADLIGLRPYDREKICHLARMIQDASERGSSVTRRLLAFARRDELRLATVETTALLDDLTAILGPTLGSSIKLHLEIEADLPPVLTDKGQLETAVINLATNARDAMPEGGTLTISATREEVPDASPHRAGLAPGLYIRLSVTDTGKGMDAVTLARAGEPFFTTKPRSQGTGLGLAMTRSVAEQSGGSLLIDSAPGRGTTIILWLPAISRQAEGSGTFRQSADSAPLPSGPPIGARRVLLVDDDLLVLEILGSQLEDAGYAVLPAGSGAEGLARLDAGDPIDILVTDLSMPDQDGISVIREAQKRRPRLPAVLLTGYAGDADGLAVSGSTTGTFSLLRKPVSMQRLLECIAPLLDGGHSST